MSRAIITGHQSGKTAIMKRAMMVHMQTMKPGDKILVVKPNDVVTIKRSNDCLPVDKQLLEDHIEQHKDETLLLGPNNTHGWKKDEPQ